MTSLREKRRAEITKSAIRVFGKYGYHEGKVGEIAKGAGLGKGTIYEYFDSKKDIFHYSLRYIFNSYTEGIKEAIDSQETTRDKLVTLLDYNCNFIDDYEHMMERSFSHFENILIEIKPYLEEVGKKIYDFILAIVTEGIENGELRSDLDKTVASLMILGIMSSSHIQRDLRSTGHIEQINNPYIIDMVLQGLEAK